MARVATLSFEEFLEAEAAWERLVAASTGASPFVAHAWLRIWWRHFGRGSEFVALVVRESDELLAAAPIALRPARFAGLRWTVAELAGTAPVPTRGMGLADRADLLVRREAAEAREQLAAGLRRLLERADVLHLKGFEADSPTPAALAAASRPHTARVLRRSTSPYLRLDHDWQAYLQSRSQRFRKNLKRFERKLREAGQPELRRLGPGDDARRWMEEIAEVNAASWKAARGTNLLRHPRLRAFFAELVPELAARGGIDLHLLRVGGRAAAYELGFDFAGRVVAYNASFREEYREAGPGTLVTAAVIRSACERGRTEYDMGRGADDYKLRWSGTCRVEHELLLAAPRLPARLYAWAGGLRGRLRGWPWLNELDDRLSGLRSRARHRG